MDKLWKQSVKDITDGAYFQVEKTLGGGDEENDRVTRTQPFLVPNLAPQNIGFIV